MFGKVANGIVALGANAGRDGTSNPGENSIIIGKNNRGAGNNSIVIGANPISESGSTLANIILLNATPANINPTTANSLYVSPIRNANTSANTVFYDPSTKEMTYGIATAPIPTAIVSGTSTANFNTFGWFTVSDSVGTFMAMSSQRVTIGLEAAFVNPSGFGVAIGGQAGRSNQGTAAIAIGDTSARLSQGTRAIAIGSGAAKDQQGANAIAIGTNASSNLQGVSSIAIGANSVANNQSDNSLALNATGLAITANVANAFYVAPMRNDTANTSNVMYYNTSTKEITYAGSPKNFGPINESVLGLNAPGPTISCNCATTTIFRVELMNQTPTVAITNLTTPEFYGTVVTLFLNQTTTAYIPTVLTIAGATQTIKWQGGVVPLGNPSKLDVVAFTILRTGATTYIVTGQMVSYG
jgi:hypothetical protein